MKNQLILILLSLFLLQGCFDNSSPDSSSVIDGGSNSGDGTDGGDGTGTNVAPVALNYVYPNDVVFGDDVVIPLESLGFDENNDLLTLHNIKSNPNILDLKINNDFITFRVVSGGDNIIKFQLSDGQLDSNIGSLTVHSKPITKRQHQRFITQSTYGISSKGIGEYDGFNPVEWLDNQYSKPVTSHTKLTDVLCAYNYSTECDEHEAREDAWFEIALSADDQLKQRVAFALSEIFVVSRYGPLNKKQQSLSNYYDLLVENSLGNYRELLGKISRHPAMGAYLTMINSRKANEKTGSMPDENYAREVMQLFSVGLYLLNQDGTKKLDSAGNFIPTYTQDDVQNIARAFTGWIKSDDNYILPMTTDINFHDINLKKVLGYTIPSGQSVDEDMDSVLDILFYHPNTPPFIANNLIVKLVSSNPSPEYIKRVADVFIDNGSGQRGDLFAVIKSILLDREALGLVNEHPPAKIKEPIISTLNLMRGLDNIMLKDHMKHSQYAYNPAGQAPLRSPSVFNFYAPEYQISDGFSAPEAELVTWSRFNGISNYHRRYILKKIKELSPDYNYFLDSLTVDDFIKKVEDMYIGESISSDVDIQLRDILKGGVTESSIKNAFQLISMSDDFIIQD
ncbi:TPA: DUF1800 domain-containing protein [Photobacterium damselae]